MVRAAAVGLLVTGAVVLFASTVQGTPVAVPLFGLVVAVAGIAGVLLENE